MNCPYYIDFTRNCLKTYPMILKYRDYSLCESEKHHKCLIYTILKSDFRCKYLDSCLNMFPLHLPEFFKLLNEDDTIYEFVTKPIFDFCLSKKNNTKCARFKIKEERQEPPPGLNPNGQTVSIADTISKRKIILEQSPKQIF